MTSVAVLEEAAAVQVDNWFPHNACVSCGHRCAVYKYIHNDTDTDMDTMCDNGIKGKVLGEGTF